MAERRIRNIVLDIGNVLGHFCWERVFEEMLDLHGEDFDRVAAVTTRSNMWAELDRGLLSDQEVADACVQRSPEDEEKIRAFFTHQGDLVVDFEYSEEWIRSLKVEGYRVYILSNFGRTCYLNCRKNGCLSFVDLADGALISFEVQKVKPEQEIYEIFLKRFGLVAEECLFFDDKEENVLAAREAGMYAEVFTTLEEAERILQTIEK